MILERVMKHLPEATLLLLVSREDGPAVQAAAVISSAITSLILNF